MSKLDKKEDFKNKFQRHIQNIKVEREKYTKLISDLKADNKKLQDQLKKIQATSSSSTVDVPIARVISPSDVRAPHPPIPPSCKNCKICNKPLNLNPEKTKGSSNSRHSRRPVLIHVNNCVVHKACTETCD